MNAPRINVEVLYALPGQQPIFKVQLDEGVTVEDAIRASGVLDAFPEVDLARNKIGLTMRNAIIVSLYQLGECPRKFLMAACAIV